jgi:hypothetical protein
MIYVVCPQEALLFGWLMVRYALMEVRITRHAESLGHQEEEGRLAVMGVSLMFCAAAE